jgi:hypothetical protein
MVNSTNRKLKTTDILALSYMGCLQLCHSIFHTSFVTLVQAYDFCLVAVPPDMARTIDALCVSFLSTVATVVPVTPRNAKIIRALWELEEIYALRNLQANGMVISEQTSLDRKIVQYCEIDSTTIVRSATAFLCNS